MRNKLTPEEKERRKNVFNKLNSITIFRGSLSEYERWKGYGVK